MADRIHQLRNENLSRPQPNDSDDNSNKLYQYINPRPSNYDHSKGRTKPHHCSTPKRIIFSQDQSDSCLTGIVTTGSKVQNVQEKGKRRKSIDERRAGLTNYVNKETRLQNDIQNPHTPLLENHTDKESLQSSSTSTMAEPTFYTNSLSFSKKSKFKKRPKNDLPASPYPSPIVKGCRQPWLKKGAQSVSFKKLNKKQPRYLNSSTLETQLNTQHIRKTSLTSCDIVHNTTCPQLTTSHTLGSFYKNKNNENIGRLTPVRHNRSNRISLRSLNNSRRILADAPRTNLDFSSEEDPDQIESNINIENDDAFENDSDSGKHTPPKLNMSNFGSVCNHVMSPFAFNKSSRNSCNFSTEMQLNFRAFDEYSDNSRDDEVSSADSSIHMNENDYKIQLLNHGKTRSIPAGANTNKSLIKCPIKYNSAFLDPIKINNDQSIHVNGNNRTNFDCRYDDFNDASPIQSPRRVMDNSDVRDVSPVITKKKLNIINKSKRLFKNEERTSKGEKRFKEPNFQRKRNSTQTNGNTTNIVFNNCQYKIVSSACQNNENNFDFYGNQNWRNNQSPTFDKNFKSSKIVPKSIPVYDEFGNCSLKTPNSNIPSCEVHSPGRNSFYCSESNDMEVRAIMASPDLKKMCRDGRSMSINDENMIRRTSTILNFPKITVYNQSTSPQNIPKTNPNSRNESPNLIGQQFYHPDEQSSYFHQMFKVDKKLGSGSFGEVFRVSKRHETCSNREPFDCDKYAVKKSLRPFCSNADRKAKFKEVKQQQLLKVHPNIVMFIQAWEEEGYLYIQQELCKMSLQSLMESSPNNQKLSESLVWDYMVDMLLGINHLHTYNRIHLDIKPSNIFIGLDGRLKIGDFGLVVKDRSIDTENQEKSSFHKQNKTIDPSDEEDGIDYYQEGDNRYMAQELLDNKFTRKADIFSLGVVVLEISSGLDPPQYGTLWHDLRSGNGIPSEFSSQVSAELYRIILLMLEPYPKRISASELLQIKSISNHTVIRLAHFNESKNTDKGFNIISKLDKDETESKLNKFEFFKICYKFLKLATTTIVMYFMKAILKLLPREVLFQNEIYLTHKKFKNKINKDNYDDSFRSGDNHMQTVKEEFTEDEDDILYLSNLNGRESRNHTPIGDSNVYTSNSPIPMLSRRNSIRRRI